MASANRIVKKSFSFSRKILVAPGKSITCVLTAVTNSWNRLGIRAGMISRTFLSESVIPKKDYPYLKEADGLGLANSVLDFQKAYKTFRDQKRIVLLTGNLRFAGTDPEKSRFHSVG